MARLSSSNGVVPPHAITSDEDSDDSYYVPSTPFSRRLAQVDPSLYQGNGDDFCTVENLAEASTFVNHQLSIYGFPSNLQFNGTDEKQAVAIVTAFYKVLQQHQKDVEYREEMGENWRRLSGDHEIAINNLATTKARLQKSDREVDILNGRISMLENELRTEVDKHKNTKEELKACKGNLQYTKSQFVHESRKKEQEINSLRDKVQKAMNDRFNRASIGITLLNPVTRKAHQQSQHHLSIPPKVSSAHGGGAQQSAKSENELLLEEVINQQRDKEIEIVSENEQLRKTLYAIHVELNKFLRKHGAHKDKGAGSPNAYGLPFFMVKDKIEAEIRDQLTTLGDQWTHRPAPESNISPTEVLLRDQRIQELEKAIDKLQLEQANSIKLVQGAQTMIDNMTNSQLLNGIQQFKLQLEESEMTAPELDEAQAKIQKQREELDKEREQFTQACLDLGRQRDQLDHDRAEFEANKRTFQLEEFLAYLDDSASRTTAETASELVRNLSTSPSHAAAQQQQQHPRDDRLQTLTTSNLTSHSSGAMSTKRPATATLNAFQPSPKKPMISRLAHRSRIGTKLYPSRVEEGEEEEPEEKAQEAVPPPGESEKDSLLRSPTRTLGRTDRNLGFRDIAKNNAMVTRAQASQVSPNVTKGLEGQQQKQQSRSTLVSDDSRTSLQRPLVIGDLNTPNTAPVVAQRPSAAVRETTADPTPSSTYSIEQQRPPPSSIFGRVRPQSIPFSFRSAMSLGGGNDSQQNQPCPPSPLLSSSRDLLSTGIAAAPKPSSFSSKAASAETTGSTKQSSFLTSNDDRTDRRISLKSSMRLPPAMSRAASSMVARKRGQMSQEQQSADSSTSVDPIITFTAPSVSLSNNTLPQQSYPSTAAPTTAAAIATSTTTTSFPSSSSLYSRTSLPAAQQRQQMYESNRRAFTAARTSK